MAATIQEVDIDELVSEISMISLSEDLKPKGASSSIKVRKNGVDISLDKKSLEDLSKKVTSAYDDWIRSDD
ncbi:hypothetical protein DSO57_1014140 [Entomophthora muscae]|uniref:Uncharacterized protein n=4 Tax=Entomophthora muscae TaxID=34485 RepID=A0ACC2S7J0_9FUNG|nr:hypothetical protein DSO57_1038758 [Entomophthora muscae]KAJ9058255.1 hypothetical protein DSO57_1014140 [Entomophthora muscae]